ncbi:MAG: ATP-grasp domain-containing protein, partial [Alphaproteobacteria bacterium]|nr:ATP-grasp domain-containing protein [Alphaproteobacteria bacterium]
MESFQALSFPNEAQGRMNSGRALLVGDFGNHYMIVFETASLLKRAGFAVDLVTNNPVSRKLTSIDHFVFVDNADDLPRVALERSRETTYDLISIMDDFALMGIVRSNLSDEEKLALLPVVAPMDIRHIGSKIGLSMVLQQAGVRTPKFAVAHDKTELNEKIEEVGFPAFVKIDFSGAGDGTFECNSRTELDAVGNDIHIWPVLVQEKIEGYEVDLSAFYQNAELVFFSYST